MATRFQVTIDCPNPGRLTHFWAAALHYEIEAAPAGFNGWNAFYRSLGVPEEELDEASDAGDSIVDPSSAPSFGATIPARRAMLMTRCAVASRAGWRKPMEPEERVGALPELWICPRCGARLVSRNLWHSCGRHDLTELFARATPGVVELAAQYVTILESLGDVQVIVQKTRLVVVARVRFAGLEPRRAGFLANFALHRWLDSPRIVKTIDYGPRWRVHYLQIRSASELDEELRSWLQESHDVVGVQSDLPGRR